MQALRFKLLPMVAVVVIGMAVGWFGVAHALGPYADDTYGSCHYFGSSSMGWPYTSVIATGKVSGTCDQMYHVHGYFWGSDLQWHYAEKTDYSNTQIQVSWTYWTDNVYGYHKYPSSNPTTLESWDY
jgi:hypothetical protein